MYWVKGNPDFHSILNWILQILHYYCRKQHKNIKNSQMVEQNLVFFLLFSCGFCFLLPFSMAEFFISWTQYYMNSKSLPQVIIFAIGIVLFSGLKMIFSKLNQLRYHCLYKKLCLLQFKLFHVFNYRVSIQIFLSYKFFCTNLAWIRNS